MIKQTTARALQISTMGDFQINLLHELEQKKGYILPNWNIQQLFQLTTIKDNYNVSDDLEDQAEYRNRIEKEIDRLMLKNMVEHTDNSLDWFHGFDWAVYKKHGEISWEGGGKKGNILQRLSKAVPLLLLALIK